MLRGALGKKIGMTQVFSEDNKVVPVTVIDISNWFVTNVKTKDKDGYDAIQLGSLRKKYKGNELKTEWLKDLDTYFEILKEVERTELESEVEVGKPIDFASLLEVGQMIDVSGTTKGKGFQGVVKRHGFSGGKASHGPRFGRKPGSIGFMRSQGRVVKGKKMPGHMGVEQRLVRNLKIVDIKPDDNVVLVKGSVPGNAGSLVFLRKV